MTVNTAVQGLTHPWSDPPAEGEATEVAPGILWMRLPLPMALDHVNVFALADEDGWTIIDTGFDTKRSRAIWQRLLDGPLAAKPVARILITHHHPDHVGLAGWFQADHGAELLMSRTAWLLARMLVLDEQPLPVPETLAFWRAAGMDAAIYAQRAASRPYNFADVVTPMPLGYTRVVEGQSLRLGGRDWTVRMGDGHAPEHITLWSADGELVLGGDQLLPGISPNIGVYATEPDADPITDWLEACARLAPHATDAQLVLPGHKLPYRGLPLRLHLLADNHVQALDRLISFLDQPRKASDCFALLFKRNIGEKEYGFALVEAVAHLNHLRALGRVDRRMSPDGVWLWQRKDNG